MELKNLDLSQYKLAYFVGNSLGNEHLTQDQVMALAEVGRLDDDYMNLEVALIPKDKKLTECGGDDWNDNSAADNASSFYDYPKGTIFLKGWLGKELKVTDKLYE